MARGIIIRLSRSLRRDPMILFHVLRLPNRSHLRLKRRSKRYRSMLQGDSRQNTPRHVWSCKGRHLSRIMSAGAIVAYSLPLNLVGAGLMQRAHTADENEPF